MNIFKSFIISDLLLSENIKEIKIKRSDDYALTIGCNIIVDFLGYKRPYTIAYYDDDSIVIIIKNQLTNSRGFTNKLFESNYVSNELSYDLTTSNFRFDKKNILFISAGIGITPFIQVLKEYNSDSYKHIHFCKDNECQFYSQYLSKNSELILSSNKSEIKVIDTKFYDVIYICGGNGFVDFVKNSFSDYCDVIVESFEFNPNVTGNYIHIKNNSFIDIEGEELLNHLNKNDVSVQGDCYQGICGSCVLSYRDAVIEHNDLILSDEERECFFTPCCSKILTDSIEIKV